ncbi:restriction endonuclease subunit S [Ligilactobacillus aviarius]|uniref:restriction endonuclease subunit S n=1 Tax=Ligilactobacillus aviarius TaxID=1606 RepID=UPI0024BB007E|nr:restriction endonuclease subunit S [Ligilactobacillus aviarius]
MTKADKEEQRKTPILRFKGFTDDWEQRQLSNVIKLIGGNAFKGSSAVKEGIPWLKITNVGKNGINWDTQFYLPFSFWNKWPNYQLFSGDYVMALTRPVLDHTLKIGKMDRKALLNQRVSKLEFNFDKEFTFQLLQRKKTVIEIEKELAGSDPPNLGSKNLKNIKIFLSVNPDEQKRIGLLFRCLDNLLALYDRKLKLLSQVKKYFLDNLFTEKEYPNLRFKGFTDAWEQRKLGEIGTTYSGLSGKNKSDFEKGNSNFVTFLEVLNNPVLKNIDLTNKVEIKENEHQNKVKRNDILFNTSSETPEEVATSTVVEVNQDNLYLNSFCFGFRPNIQFSNYYIGYYLRSNHFRSKVFCLAQGISRYNISKKSLIKLKLSLPKLEEQDKIGKIFNRLELLLNLYENKQQHLTKIKKTLLNTMFI